MKHVTYYDLDGNKSETKVPGGRTRVRTFFDPDGEESASQTQQQFSEQTDVNYIMKKYTQTGEITHLARKQGVYADVSQIPDLQTAFQQVRDAESAFMTLPAELRKKLDHDPVNLVEYLNDPKNNEEAISYGLKIHPALPNDDDLTTTTKTAGKQKPSKSPPPSTTTTPPPKTAEGGD